MKKIVVDISKLTNGIIMEIADELGCDIKSPYSYSKAYEQFAKMAELDKDKEMSKEEKDIKYKEIRERLKEIKEEDEKEWHKYMINITNWLKERGYII